MSEFENWVTELRERIGSDRFEKLRANHYLRAVFDTGWSTEDAAEMIMCDEDD